MTHETGCRTPRLFTDADVRNLEPRWAVDVMADVVRAHALGELAAPARVSADVGLASPGDSSGRTTNTAIGGAAESPGRLVMTAGRTREWFGYRVYDTLPTTRGEQVVVAHDGETGDVAAIAVGSELGAYRTGALGGVVMRALVGADDAQGSGVSRPVRVAGVGAGRQAWTQLWAASGVLDIEHVTITSRTLVSAERLAARVRDELEIPCGTAEYAETAVRDADVVIVATTSATPVIDAAWLPADCLVVTLGPKQVGRAEFGLDLLDGAFVVTDSPEQLRAYDPPALAADVPAVSLGDVLTGRVEPATTGRCVYLSVGLAGTEVALLAAMAAR